MVNERFQTLVPTDEQKDYARRNISSSEYFQRKDTRDASDEEQYYSFLGEVVISDAFNNERPLLNKTVDKGYDVDWFGTMIDVKVRSLNAPPKENYEVKVLAEQLQEPDPDKFLLFLLYNPQKEVFYVAGIMSCVGYKNTAWLLKDGEIVYANNYVADGDQYINSIKNLAVARIPE